jgi:alpha-galactosidase
VLFVLAKHAASRFGFGSDAFPYFTPSCSTFFQGTHNIPLDEYIERCEALIMAWGFLEETQKAGRALSEDEIRGLLKDTNPMPTIKEGMIGGMMNFNRIERSVEYGSGIIHSMETGTPRIIYGNVPNIGIISNLPKGCCVEVPCLVDKNGIQPTYIGDLPPHLVALMQTNINVQCLAVEAALTGKREHIYHAAMLDPHTAAELPLDQIWAMVDELIEAHGDWLPKYQ